MMSDLRRPKRDLYPTLIKVVKQALDKWLGYTECFC